MDIPHMEGHRAHHRTTEEGEVEEVTTSSRTAFGAEAKVSQNDIDHAKVRENVWLCYADVPLPPFDQPRAKERN